MFILSSNQQLKFLTYVSIIILLSGILSTAEEGCRCRKQQLRPQLFSSCRREFLNSHGINWWQHQWWKICLQDQQGASRVS